MNGETKPVFRLLKNPNGLVKLEWIECDVTTFIGLGQKMSASLTEHIQRGLMVKSYGEYLMFPKAWGLPMFDALTITSDNNAVVCVMIGSACSIKTASLFIDAASWQQSLSFQN